MISLRIRLALLCASALGLTTIFPLARAEAERIAIGDQVAETAFQLLTLGSGITGVGGSGWQANPQNANLQIPQGGANVVVVSVPASNSPGTTVTSGSDGDPWGATVVDTDSLTSPANPAQASPIAPLVTDYVSSDRGPLDRAGLVHQLAVLVAGRTKVSAFALESVWLRTDDRRMRVVLTAMSQVGTPYRYGGNQPGGFDCSGLTSFSWSQVGIRIPRTSSDQINALSPRGFDQLLPGDLIWRPGHIGMYLGVGDAMVHSPQTGKSVEVTRIGRSSRYGSPFGSS